MANSFTRILAKKLCRVVICSPPTGAQLSSDLGQPSDDDPAIGFEHDHRYAGRPVSPILKRLKSDSACTGKASCCCLRCLQPSLQDETEPLSLSFFADGEPGNGSERVSPLREPAPVTVVGHSRSRTEPRARVKSEASSSSAEVSSPSPVSSPGASSGATDYRLTNSFQCRLCDFRATKLREYMEQRQEEMARLEQELEELKERQVMKALQSTNE